jgi:uncharacterized membrane protein
MLAATMESGFAEGLTVACVAGAGLVAGAYFLFSNFVLGGLRELPPGAGVAAMQAMNRAAPNPLFVLALVGTGVACGVLAVTAVTRWSDGRAPWAFAGSALYLVSLALTIGYHVPRNDAFDRIDPTASSAADAWRRYLVGWVPWNHVRALAALGCTVALAISLAQ